jgi:hypothetical protein
VTSRPRAPRALLVSRTPYLNEFAVHVPDARAVHRRLLERGVLAGLALADVLPDEPSLADGLLVCATEVTTDDEIARFAAALAAELGAYDHAEPARASAAAGHATAPSRSDGSGAEPGAPVEATR